MYQFDFLCWNKDLQKKKKKKKRSQNPNLSDLSLQKYIHNDLNCVVLKEAYLRNHMTPSLSIILLIDNFLFRKMFTNGHKAQTCQIQICENIRLQWRLINLILKSGLFQRMIFFF